MEKQAQLKKKGRNCKSLPRTACHLRAFAPRHWLKTWFGVVGGRPPTALRLDPPPTVLNSEMAIFGPGGHVHVRSRTEKRPSSRPLLLSCRPLFAVYMPYLLSYCAGATSCPDPAVAAPPWPSPCAASVSCVMGHGEWLCCCGICCWCSPEAKKIWLCATSTSTHAAAAAAAFFSLLLPLLRLSLLPCLLGGPAALVAAPHVPTTPMFLFERNPVLRNTNSCFF